MSCSRFTKKWNLEYSRFTKKCESGVLQILKFFKIWSSLFRKVILWAAPDSPKIEIWSTPDSPKNVDLEYSRFTKKDGSGVLQIWKIWKSGVASVQNWNLEYSRFTFFGESGVLQIPKKCGSGVLQIHLKMWIWSTPDLKNLEIWSS